MKQTIDHKVYEVLPEEMRQSVEMVLQDDLPRFLQSGSEPPSIRVNTLKTTVKEMFVRLNAWQIEASPHPFSPEGIILHNRDNRHNHTLEYYAGKFHGQGISSQIPVLALQPKPGDSVLDMAASPGSKSTQIAAMMQNRGRLLLCDPSPRRQQALLTNLARAGVINDVYLQMPGQRMGRLFHESFDKVLLDSPCSALSKLPEQKLRSYRAWTLKDIVNLHNTQFPLLVSAVKAAKPGAEIVYSTCTLPIEENEAMLDRLIKEYPVEIKDITWLEGPSIYPGFTELGGNVLHPSLSKTRRVLPFPVKMEAFFVARLAKTDTLPLKGYLKKSPLFELKLASDPEINSVLDYIGDRWGVAKEFFAGFHFHLTSKRLWLCSADWQTVPSDMFVKTGLAIAVRKYDRWKLTSNGAQFLGDRITRNRIELEESDLKILFKDGRLVYDRHADGYYALSFRNEIIAAISVMAGKMKTSIPHRFDLLI